MHAQESPEKALIFHFWLSFKTLPKQEMRLQKNFKLLERQKCAPTRTEVLSDRMGILKFQGIKKISAKHQITTKLSKQSF